MDSLPGLNGSKNTIFGRLLSGTRTLHQIEGFDELARTQASNERRKDDIAKEAATLGKFGLKRRSRDYTVSDTEITICNAGVYKIGMNEQERLAASAAGQSDFVPLDFMQRRKK